MTTYDTGIAPDASFTPDDYTVIDGHAYFRGPDGTLWFAPPLGDSWEFECAQNAYRADVWFYDVIPADHVAYMASIAAQIS